MDLDAMVMGDHIAANTAGREAPQCGHRPQPEFRHRDAENTEKNETADAVLSRAEGGTGVSADRAKEDNEIIHRNVIAGAQRRGNLQINTDLEN